MEDKTRFIIIALLGLLATSLLVNLHVDGLRKKIERQENALQEENVLLAKKIEEAGGKINSLKSDLDKLSQEKEEILKEVEKKEEEERRRYELVVKERDELLEKLKAREAKKEVKEAKLESLSSTEDAYWAEVLKAKTNLELELEKMRSELKTLKLDNEQLKRGKGVWELDLSSLMREKRDLEQQLEYNQKKLDNITVELVRERNARRRLQESLKSAKDENKLLRRQLKSLSERKMNLERKVTQLQEEKSQLQHRFNEMEVYLEEKFSQMDELKRKLETMPSTSEAEILPPKKESIELPPIVVRPPIEAPAPQVKDIQSEGKILAVNKENNFVIIDLGKDSGLRVGDIFKVYRDDEPVATIEVIEVRKRIAACDIKKEITSIKVGDTVR